ncbi:MAG TPA: hypothetical protein VFQ37_14540, partial [Mycobacterium sp.]|nr:hypothetical protein [Mycobacterium sp.]
MAIFGRKTARRRLRTAARQSLAMPAFSAPVDCTTWVLDGLWPAELAAITPETATLAEYLNADLQRIAHSANDKLQAISRSGLAGRARQAAETRVINVARAFAVLRVESTVRQLHQEALQFRAEQFSLNPVPQVGDPVERLQADSDGHEVDEQPYNARHRRPETIVVQQPDQGPAA